MGREKGQLSPGTTKGGEEPEKWRDLKGRRASRCTVLLTGRPVSDRSLGRRRLDLGTPSSANQKSPKQGPGPSKCKGQRDGMGWDVGVGRPPSFQPIPSRSRGRAPDDVGGVDRCPPLPPGVSGFYVLTSGLPQVWMVWARNSLSTAPERIQGSVFGE